METITGLPLKLLILYSIIIGDLLTYTDSELVNCLESDREALVDFKNGLHDPENRLSSWKGSNCCEWRGISCENSTGAVIAVDLHNPYPKAGFESSGRYGFWNISGEIRPSLTKLKSLRHLDLSFNTFNDNPIPEFFGLLKNLQYLSLSSAGFSGAVPSNLGNLSSLEYLDLKDSWNLHVENFEWLSGLVSLNHLMMNMVDLSMVGSDWVWILTKLPSLTELQISTCSLSGSIPPLTFVNRSSLAVLDLSFNLFESKIPDWLVNISSLVSLNISNCGWFGRVPLAFSELPNLQVLNLLGNEDLRGSCYQLLSGRWEKIRVLDLASLQLHGKLPASIGNLTSLIHFDIFSNNVEGGIPRSIGKLCNLVFFSLPRNNVTGTIPKFLEGTENCLSSRPLPSLQNLDLSDNYLVGELPEWLSRLETLVQLDLSENFLYGRIPASLGLLQNLSVLRLDWNELNGTLPESLGQLSKLSSFRVSSNHLTGILTETNFLKHSKLKDLYLSSNSFTLDVSSNWVPPFQVKDLRLSSCHLGPSFPAWLKSQEQVEYLDLSNTGISGSIPDWFWEHSSNLLLLNVSYNQMEGQLPSPINLAAGAVVDFSSNFFDGSIPVPSGDVLSLDLSKNKLSGAIPNNLNGVSLGFLSISNNQINGEIPASIGSNTQLKVINLANNNLTGSIPSSIGNCSSLLVLDLRKNNLSGNIPGSLGQLGMLQTLHLSDNKLIGELPSSLLNLSSLETMDLGNNRLMGRIPPWIGEGFASLRILCLRLNAFSGELPTVLSNLSSIQVLDLAGNQFHGSIPSSFGYLKAMTQIQNNNSYLLGVSYPGYYEENLAVTMKNQSLIFSKTLYLVISLDLSGNNLSGCLPSEITKLLGLVFVNLSRNHISGHIPESISKLKQLSSLDLSSNKLSGAIPQSLASLSFLGYIDLSNNDLTGRIPYKSHLTTFEASSFTGNPGLCGSPLAVKCPGDDDDDDDDNPDKGRTTSKDNSNGDSFINKWFYLSVGLGFAAGILVPFLVMAMRKSWSVAYFGAVDDVLDRLLYLWLKYRTIQQRTRRHHQRR